MSLTIIVGFEKRLEEIYTLNLSTYVGTEVVAKPDFASFEELAKLLPKIDLIICNCTDGELAKSVDNFLQEQQKGIPFIVYGNSAELKTKHIHLEQLEDIKPLIQSAAKVLGVDAKSMVKQIVPKYYPISINYFTCLIMSICDVYHKDEEHNYELLFSSDTKIDHSKINKLIQSNITSLYILSENRLKIVAQVTQNIVATLAREDLSAGERIQSTSATMEIVRKNIGMDVEGMSQETVEMASAAINSLEKVVEDEPSLKNLLAHLFSNPSTYIFKHSQLITFLSCHAIDKMEWGNDEQKKKIAFVAFFHDIALIRDDLAQIESEAALNNSNLRKEDKDRVSKHALKAAKLIMNFPKSPIGVETIIKQHHGSRNGVGFPRHFGDNISPVAIIFIVCEAVCGEILQLQEKSMPIEIEDILKKLSYKFTSEKYSNVLKALENLNFS